MFDPSAAEMGKAWVAAVIVGIAVAGIAWWLAYTLPGAVGRYVYILGPAAAGWLIGMVTYRASGFKRSRKLQVASGGSTFLSYMLMSFVMGTTIGGFIGLAVGMYYAIGSVKPPRGA